MNIVMMTNTFTPHVGGVARSVQAFSAEYRQRGHRVLVVAPTYEEMPENEEWVVRIPAIQNFNASDFSLPVPAPSRLRSRLDDFEPDVVHSHHPFLLGVSALRAAAERGLPVVFTHHTLYERYTHYVPGDSPQMKKLAIELAVGYCDLCDAVIAPSDSVADLLRDRGVETRIEVIPTGVDVERFSGGDGAAARQRAGIPPTTFVAGHVGRLAEEKNLPLLARALVRFAGDYPQAHVVVAGRGSAEDAIVDTFEERGIGDRLHFMGRLDVPTLADVYAAMDVFVFASQTETQGMVLTEAMAAGVPVVAIDASGVREVVEDMVNGRLIQEEDAEELARALAWVAEASPERRRELADGARRTADELSLPRTAERALALYRSLRALDRTTEEIEDSAWQQARRRLREEWKIVKNRARALGDSLKSGESRPEER